MSHRRDFQSTAASLAAVSGMATALGTGIACVGPLVAILLGIGGFGWLVQYAHLRVPATITTGVLLALGFYLTSRRATDDCRRRKQQRARMLLWSATTLALAINLFEYVIFPRLG